MVSIKDIKNANSIYRIPKYVHANKGIQLDYRLCDALSVSKEDNVRDYNYDFDVYLEKYGINLQRPYVWEHCQQSEFILSLLLEKPIESVVVVQHNADAARNRNEIINFVIDGKQRLMTIQKFLNNEITVAIDGQDVFYKDFDDELKCFFKRTVNSITATVYYSYEDAPVDDDMKIILFNYYNFSGTAQTEEHKNKLQTLLKKEYVR